MVHGENSNAKATLADKYDTFATTYSGSRYARPNVVADGQLRLISGWGSYLPAGASILEIGCADGFVTQRLAAAGYNVHAIDISPAMIDAVAARLQAAGLKGSAEAADIESFHPQQEFDAVLAIMWNFFEYVREPRVVLPRLAASTKTKLVLDVNPRVTPLASALAAVREAGFDHVSWRPHFMPQNVRVGSIGLAALRAGEAIPGVRDFILRHRFTAVIKGERRGPTP